jgi:hypothetical protein
VIKISIAATTLALLMASAPVATEQRSPVDRGPGTVAAARKYLEGRWDMQTFDIMPPGQATIHLATPASKGTLIYDDFGNLEMDIKVDEPTAKLLAAAGIQTRSGSLYSKGKTAVDMQGHTLRFVLQGQPATGAPSGPIALNKLRHWEVEGNILTLSTKDEAGKVLSVGKWQKAP